MEIDYKELLSKYVRHLKFCGSDTLLEDNDILDSPIEFTADELEFLNELDYD